MYCILAAPTAVRNLRPKPSEFTPTSLFICWDHPEYPNSQLLTYLIYYAEQDVLQSDGNFNITNYTEIDTMGTTMTSYNLTGLNPFTNYSILVTVTGSNVDDAPFEVEILSRTNATGKVCMSYSVVQIKVNKLYYP